MKHLLITTFLACTFFVAAAQDDEKAGRFLANCSWISAESHQRYSSLPDYQGKLMQFAIAVKVNKAGLAEQVLLFDKDQLLDSILREKTATAEIMAEKSAFANVPGSVVVCYVTLQNMHAEPENKARNPDPRIRAQALEKLRPFSTVRIIDPFIIAMGAL
ncbi:hypothetical protein [Pedobacter yulinensis]|nr:hypothetical protein [Pedobacter yulinensis]